MEFIELVGLKRFARSYPHELSVGMRQRASIARAFVADPEMLLMDEPFGSLDALTKLILQEELLRIWSLHRKLVVYVTHDIAEAVLLGDRVLVMSGPPRPHPRGVPSPAAAPAQPARSRAAGDGEDSWRDLERARAGSPQQPEERDVRTSRSDGTGFWLWLVPLAFTALALGGWEAPGAPGI